MRYRIKHHAEEFACPTCGEPLYVGDTAWQEPGDGPVYCSAYCAGANPYRDLRDRITTAVLAGEVPFMSQRQARRIFGD